LAEHHYSRALELNPSSATLMAGFGDLHITLGRPLEALDYFNKARALDPFFDPSWFWPIIGVAHFLARQYDEAIIALERSVEAPYWAHLFLAASHAMLDNIERARHHAGAAQPVDEARKIVGQLIEPGTATSQSTTSSRTLLSLSTTSASSELAASKTL